MCPYVEITKIPWEQKYDDIRELNKFGEILEGNENIFNLSDVEISAIWISTKCMVKLSGTGNIISSAYKNLKTNKCRAL